MILVLTLLFQIIRGMQTFQLQFSAREFRNYPFFAKNNCIFTSPHCAGADQVTDLGPGALSLAGGALMDPARCRTNLTAQTGLTASLYCCLGTANKDLGVREYLLFEKLVPFLDNVSLQRAEQRS